MKRLICIVALIGLVCLAAVAFASVVNGGPVHGSAAVLPEIGLLGLGALGLCKSFIPTPQDEAMRLEASATKTANFAGTAYDQGNGFAPGGVGMALAAVVNVSAGDHTTGDETYSFTLMESDDGSTNWTACGPAVSIDSVAGAGGAVTIGAVSVPGFVSKQFVAVALTVGGTTPSLTYEAWLNRACCC